MVNVKKDVKVKVFIFLIVLIAIGIMALLSTQAFVTSTVENVIDYDYALNIDINDKKDLNVQIARNSKSIVDLNISNKNNSGLVNYGIVYSVNGYENSKLLPNINIYKNSSSLDETTGSINKDEEKTISIVLENNENVDLVVNFKVVLGYEFGGDLILATNEHYIYNKLVDELLYEYGNTSTILEKEESNEPGMYSTIDNDGDTYYYKNIDKYINFANNYFKILRINGDKSIRLMYIGKDINSNDHIGETNYNTLDNDNTYIGYKYGDTLQDSYELTHTNKFDSDIKKILDSWYLDNLNGYSNYISDSIFCNNRNTSLNGYNNLETNYISNIRFNNKKYSLLCNSNDIYTVNNTLLTYPIGLITYDEVKMMNLFNDYLLWTMTPSSFKDNAKVFTYSNTINEIKVSDKAFVKPVISIKEDILVKGNGTKENPYEVIYE